MGGYNLRTLWLRGTDACGDGCGRKWQETACQPRVQVHLNPWPVRWRESWGITNGSGAGKACQKGGNQQSFEKNVFRLIATGRGGFLRLYIRLQLTECCITPLAFHITGWDEHLHVNHDSVILGNWQNCTVIMQRGSKCTTNGHIFSPLACSCLKPGKKRLHPKRRACIGMGAKRKRTQGAPSPLYERPFWICYHRVSRTGRQFLYIYQSGSGNGKRKHHQGPEKQAMRSLTKAAAGEGELKGKMNSSHAAITNEKVLRQTRRPVCPWN